MSALQRLTTEYIEGEDRLRISGESADGNLESFWLTQRLLTRLVRYLVDTIESEQTEVTTQSSVDARTSALFNEIAQEAASQNLSNEIPVQSAAQEATWLVSDVDISNAQAHFLLRFRNNQNNAAEVTYDQQHLRQWLTIVHKLWEQAEWPMAVWPEWILNSAKNSPTKSKSPVH